MAKAIQADAKLLKKIAKLESEVARLSALPLRDRGPKSQRSMTEEDAKEIQVGKLKGASHKEAAEKLGLSYGQIYSARFGFTFKKQYKEANK